MGQNKHAVSRLGKGDLNAPALGSKHLAQDLVSRAIEQGTTEAVIAVYERGKLVGNVTIRVDAARLASP
ncbi:MAG TPA: hypothetical protein VI997_02200 [Candidatus Thermoplasmatota archaeon]|nr:hypothetical protein [Candidatus Thermoplasmatota archaeon]